MNAIFVYQKIGEDIWRVLEEIKNNEGCLLITKIFNNSRDAEAYASLCRKCSKKEVSIEVSIISGESNE